MEPIEYIRIFRRRWLVIVGFTIVGLVAGFATAKGATPPPAPNVAAASAYKATALLQVSTTIVDPSGYSLGSMAVLASSEPVAKIATKTLGLPSSYWPKIRASVTAQTSTTAVFLNLSSTQAAAPAAWKAPAGYPPTAPGYAADVANNVGAALITYLNLGIAQKWNQQLSTLAAAKANLASQVAHYGSASGSINQANERAALNAYNVVAQQYDTLLAQKPTTTLTIQVPASPDGVVGIGGGGGGVSASVPSGHKERTALGGLAGLLLGLIACLVLERFDTRIRTRQQAEKAFGLPVIAELPRSATSGEVGGLVVIDRPTSAEAEAYMMLETSLMLAPAQTDGGTAEVSSVLISSPGRVEGKDAVVANLAASFSAAGSSVIIVGADRFDGGLSSLVGAGVAGRGRAEAPATSSFGAGSALVPTKIEDVGLLTFADRTAGNGKRHSANSADLVRASRARADIVLVDASPVLLAHDAGRLAPAVDSVILLCPLGELSSGDAALAADQLRRLGAPLAGVVLMKPARQGWQQKVMALGGWDTEDGSRQKRAAPPAPPPPPAPVVPAPEPVLQDADAGGLR